MQYFQKHKQNKIQHDMESRSEVLGSHLETQIWIKLAKFFVSSKRLPYFYETHFSVAVRTILISGKVQNADCRQVVPVGLTNPWTVFTSLYFSSFAYRTFHCRWFAFSNGDRYKSQKKVSGESESECKFN